MSALVLRKKDGGTGDTQMTGHRVRAQVQDEEVLFIWGVRPAYGATTSSVLFLALRCKRCHCVTASGSRMLLLYHIGAPECAV